MNPEIITEALNRFPGFVVSIADDLAVLLDAGSDVMVQVSPHRGGYAVQGHTVRRVGMLGRARYVGDSAGEVADAVAAILADVQD
ncbi:hypothetical protein NSA19_00915 [Actinomyces bowdenii]|uniref:hypothetical protein n=1 Tax=Actinomyces bowdenii TaxID=131109 RepID=UPI00214B41F5|nr:hypothetical protein [Actinomyces bowdenii]MCR2051437.1 hypothetical protein [Actinomyces bowdenii]